MNGPHAGFERRVQGALEATPSRIPVILGGCGTGRTTMLQRLRDRMGRGAVQYLDVERCASTPERFLTAVTSSSPFPWHDQRTPASARDAFDRTMAFMSTATAPGGAPATFLLDEVLELRTFESFPGLRHVLRDLFDALATSNNRFVLTSRYVARAHKLLRDATARFEVMHVLPLTAGEVTDLLAPAFNGYDQVSPPERDDLSRTIEALANGRASYAASIGEATARMAGTVDAVAALAALLSPSGELDRACRFCYELRLHRARGYGALKAILDILAADEPLTLTEISLRLQTHARVHQGLSVVARGRGPGGVQPQEVLVHRPAAAAVGAPALPAGAAAARGRRARGTSLRRRAAADTGAARAPRRSRRRRGAGQGDAHRALSRACLCRRGRQRQRRPEGLGHHRD